MALSFSDRQLEPILLRSLCHSDPTAWCFIPFGTSRITCCSDAFLKLWRIQTRFPPGGAATLDLHGEAIQQSFQSFGLAHDFLVDIAKGVLPGADATLTLVRNDGLHIQVTWSAVLTEEGLPSGRLVRFSAGLDSQLQERVIGYMVEARSQLAVLSERECQVLNLLFEGYTNKAIALITQISEKTVEKHRSRIMQKLRVSNTAELVRLISRARLMDDNRTMPAMHPRKSPN